MLTKPNPTGIFECVACPVTETHWVFGFTVSDMESEFRCQVCGSVLKFIRVINSDGTFSERSKDVSDF